MHSKPRVTLTDIFDREDAVHYEYAMIKDTCLQALRCLCDAVRHKQTHK
jgi:hypothetical protein